MRRTVGKDIEELTWVVRNNEDRGTARKCAAGCLSHHTHYDSPHSHRSKSRKSHSKSTTLPFQSTATPVSPTLPSHQSTHLIHDNLQSPLRLLPLPHAQVHASEKTRPPIVPHTHCEISPGTAVDYYAVSMRKLTGREGSSESEPSFTRLKAAVSERNLGKSMWTTCRNCEFLMSKGFSERNCSLHSLY